MGRPRPLWFSVIIPLLFPAIAMAESGSSVSGAPVGLVGAIIMYLICSRRKAKEIGGWLLYYYIQLYIGAIFMVVLTIVSINNYNPSLWEEQKTYMLFVFSTIPGIAIFLVQAGVATMAMKTRDYYWIKKLKLVLVLDLIFVLSAMVIDYQFFNDNLPFDVLGLIWPLIWLPYFSKSVRVEKVFVTKDRLTVPSLAPKIDAT